MYTNGRLIFDATKIAHEATGQYFLDVAIMSAEETLADFYSHDWPFMTGEGGITAIAPYSTGTATFTNGSQSVVGIGTTWLTSWPTPAIIRPTGSAGEAFPVTAFGSGTGLTIDRAWPFATVTGTYSIEFPCYPISEYVTVSGVCLGQNGWRSPLPLTSLEEILYNRNWWTPGAYPVEYFLVPGDGTTSAYLVFNPAPSSVQTIRFRYTTAVPQFRCLFGSGNSVDLGGVVTLTAGGTALTGANTSWQKLGYSLVGHYLESPDQMDIYSLVSAVGSDTGATVGAWGGRALSNSAYAISPKILMPDDFRPMLRDLMRWKYFQNSMEPELAAEAQKRYRKNYELAWRRMDRARKDGRVLPADLGNFNTLCPEPGMPWNIPVTYTP